VLYERDTELASLRKALRAADAELGSLVLITGPLGAGKSQLLRAVPERAAAAGYRLLRASGALQETEFGFGVVRQLFELAVTDLPEDVSRRWFQGAAQDVRFVFAGTCPGEGFAGMGQEAFLEGLLTLVMNISTEQPLVILVDDLQWADTPSLRWLSYLAKRLDRLRVAVVVTVRDGDPRGEQPLLREIQAAATTTLWPEPLSRRTVAAMVRDHFGEPGDDEFVRACHGVTAGNPLFVMSLLTGMRLGGFRPLRDEAHASHVLRPSLFREQLVTCLRTLPSTVREVAKAIATLGNTDADPDLVRQVADVDRLGCTEAVRVLRRLGLAAAGAPLRLSSLAAQDAVEELMTGEERGLLQQRALAQLRSYGLPADRLAHHLTAVTTPLDRWEIGMLRSAAAKAFSEGTPEVAARYLRRTLLDNSARSERATLLVELATAEREFDATASVQHVTQALALLDSPAQRASAVLRLAPSALGKSPPAVLKLIEQAADELGDADQRSGWERELALRLEARQRSLALEMPGQLAGCVRRLRGLGTTPSLDTEGERELVAVLLFAVTMAGQGRAADVASVARRILEREPASPEHVHTGLSLLVPTLIATDSVAYLSSWLDTVREQAVSRQDTLTHSLLSVEHAMLLAHNGRMAQAWERVMEAPNLEWGNKVAPSFALLSFVAVENKNSEMISGLVRKTDARTDNLLMAAILRLLRGRMPDRQEPTTAPLQHILDCGHHLERAGWCNPALFPWRALAAELHDQLGDREAAAELIEEHGALAEQWGAPATVGRALRARGELSRDGEGVALLRKAVAVLQDSENRLELAKTHLLLGKRLSALGDPAGQEYVRTARSIGEEYGVRWLADQPATPKAVAVLTETERKVASLAAEGRTNQEIAAAIGVTCRAVEKNLTKTYRKLGVRGRGELSEALTSLNFRK
jgi:DNA-binding CsgD family transcriptional regulator